MITKKIYRLLFPPYEHYLLRELCRMRSCLDVGCGKNSPLRLLTGTYKVGVDVYKPDVLFSKAQGHHDAYVVMNALDIDSQFPPKSFDCVAALDVIEHLTKQQGSDLIRKMETIAREKVIIFTPNGFYEQHNPDNPYQEHKSGWTPAEFQNKGYHVTGINGLKQLRAEESRIRFKPEFIWKIVSDVTQIFTKNRPHHAHQLLCVKNLHWPAPA